LFTNLINCVGISKILSWEQKNERVVKSLVSKKYFTRVEVLEETGYKHDIFNFDFGVKIMSS